LTFQFIQLLPVDDFVSRTCNCKDVRRYRVLVVGRRSCAVPAGADVVHREVTAIVGDASNLFTTERP
jgi:hypothetical protein